MRRFIIALLLLSSISSLNAQSWIQKTFNQTIPPGRSTTVSFSNANYGFIALGRDYFNSEFKDCWRFDPATESWTQMSDFPGTSRKNAFVFVIDSFAYIGGGYDNGNLRRDFYRFNMNADRWDTLANYPGLGLRANLSAAADGKGYVGGGYDGTTWHRDFYSYDPSSDTWTYLSDFPFGDRNVGISFSVGDTVFFGLGASDPSTDHNDLWAYDVRNAIWTQKATFLGIPRYNASITKVNGKFLVGGGTIRSTTANLGDYYLYDPLTDTWTNAGSTPLGNRLNSPGFSVGSKGYFFSGYRHPNILQDLYSIEEVGNNLQWEEFSFVEPRKSAVGFANDNFGFVALGDRINPNYLNDCWKYDPNTNHFTRMTDFPGEIRSEAIAFTIDSFAYLGAGKAQTGNKRDMYRYNMNADSWDTLVNYPGSGLQATFSAAANGKAYVGGGIGSVASNDFYEYDPQNDSWRQLPALPFGNRLRGVSFSIGDTIYFGLGMSGSIHFNDLWAYSTVDSTWTQKASFLGVSRINPVVFVVNGKVIVGGGYRNSGAVQPFSDYYEYDPTTNQWRSISNFAEGARGASATFTLGSKAYVFGGVMSGGQFGAGTFKSDLWEFSNSTVSLAEAVDEDEIYIYPNPAKDELYINSREPFEIEVFSLSGQIILSDRFPEKGRIDLKHLPSGTYLYLIRMEDSVHNGKLVISE